MATTIQARLDLKAQSALGRIAARHGWSTSRIVRESLILMDRNGNEVVRPKLIGVGEFDSGVTDLSTNKKYMEDFGKKRVGKGGRSSRRGKGK